MISMQTIIQPIIYKIHYIYFLSYYYDLTIIFSTMFYGKVERTKTLLHSLVEGFFEFLKSGKFFVWKTMIN